MKNVLRKLGLKSRAQFAAYATQQAAEGIGLDPAGQRAGDSADVTVLRSLFARAHETGRKCYLAQRRANIHTQVRQGERT